MTASKTKREVRSVKDPSELEFAAVYRENVSRMTAFFARRCSDPQQVADLTSQTFVEAIASAHTFRGRGTPLAWLVAIARRVYAQHLDGQTNEAAMIDQIGAQVVLAEGETEDLATRIDAQHRGRRLLQHASVCLSPTEREAIELVDLMDLAPKDAAQVLGISSNAVRVRLFRAHTKLRKELSNDGL